MTDGSMGRLATSGQRSRRSFLSYVVGAALLGACGGAAGGTGGTGDTGTPPSLIVRNESQFVLLELKTHPTSDHTGAVNLLDALNAGKPLPQTGQVEIVAFASGLYVTVVREQVLNGPKIAITTGVGVQLAGDSQTLLVFDESFRLLDP